MLQSFSQFLPSALQLGDSHARTATPAPEENNPPLTSTRAPESHVEAALEQKKKVKREKPANEDKTFIVVRPPPAKNNHPLNLQVQLVPPTSKERPRASSTHSRPQTPSNDDGYQSDTTENGLTRVQSSQSTQSSIYSSNTSIASTGSSNNSGRRMIIPLYNLQAHNVMTNTVVDAGTDAKVAKFKGRGLEVIGLAILEPIEVWGDAHQFSIAVGSARTSVDGGSAGDHTDTPTTPTLPAAPAPRLAPAATAPAAAPTGAKKMFGKMFRRGPRPVSLNLSSPLPPIAAALAPASAAPHLNPHTVALDSPRSFVLRPSSPLPPADSAATNTPALRPPILGVTPTFSAPTAPPQGRPSKYVWVVRRWLKGADSGLLGLKVGSRLSALGNGSGGAGGAGAGIEVRFDWTRGRIGARRKSGAAAGAGVGRGDSNGSGSAGAGSRERERLSPAAKDRHRLSGVSQQTATSDSHSHAGGDDGDESEPEDSETPWTCALSVRRLPPAPSAARHSQLLAGTQSRDSAAPGGGGADAGVRLKIATLSPTPHHPKVVSMLKVPFPLPDIEVERVLVRRRLPNAPPHPGEGLVLTAEEIKDVISCTALWLVVREGFGGVGRVGRKGDGWRIRG